MDILLRRNSTLKRQYTKRIALCIVAIALFARALVAATEELKPALVIDLRQFGYVVPDPRGQFLASTAPQDATEFLDNDTLAVSIFVQNSQPGLSVRDKNFGGSNL